jgi:penicillin amidase
MGSPRTNDLMRSRVADAMARLRDRRDRDADGATSAEGSRAKPPVRMTQGRLDLPGFDAPVEIVTDRAGVPHVFAGTRDDLYRAQGFLHGTERATQIEVMSRGALGELAALTGPGAIGSDSLVRRIGLRDAVLANARSMPRAVCRVFACYAHGLRAAYALAGHRAGRPSAREPAAISDLGVAESAVSVVLFSSFCAHQDYLLGLLRLAAAGRATGGPPIADIISGVARAFGVIPARAAGAGSNAWAYRGPHGPVVAGDPHLWHQIPGVWMPMHLSGPDGDLIGASLPGVPNIVFGHNRHVAWAITAAPAPTCHLVLERLSADGRTVDRPDGREDIAVAENRLEVRGSEPVVVPCRSTSAGGLLGLDLTDADGYHYDLAYRTILTEKPYDQLALAAMNRSRSATEFTAALRRLHGAPQTVVFADASGVIHACAVGREYRSARPLETGWEQAGDTPVSADRFGVESDGPVCVSANNAPPDCPACDAAHWEEPLRAERIRELIEDSDGSVSASVAVQLDLRSGLAARLLGLMLATARPVVDNPNLLQRLDELAAWDLRMYRDSAEAALFAAWIQRLLPYSVPMLDAAVADLYLRQKAWLTSWGFERLREWLTKKSARGDAGAGIEVGRAFCAAVGDVTRPDGSSLHWGDRHVVRFEPLAVPSSGQPSREVPALAMPGSDDTVCRGDGQQPARIGPSFRMVVDLGQIEESVWSFSPGTVGARVQHGDDVEDWRRGRYHRMLISRDSLHFDDCPLLVLRPKKPEKEETLPSCSES